MAETVEKLEHEFPRLEYHLPYRGFQIKIVLGKDVEGMRLTELVGMNEMGHLHTGRVSKDALNYYVSYVDQLLRQRASQEENDNGKSN